MRAEDLRLDELVTFSDGLVSLHGRRLILHDIYAMAQLRKEMIETIGPSSSRRILMRFGHFWGEADAAGMQRILDWDSLEEWLRAGPQLHRLQGVAKVELRSLELGQTGDLRMEVVWHDSAEAQEQLVGLGISPDAGCWILQGYASGYASHCLGRPVYFREQTCRGRGEPECVAIGMDHESWGDEADLLAPDFQADDIQGKIEELTTALRKKTLDLARERKRLREVRSAHLPDLLETRSKPYQQVLDLAGRVARYDSSVLVTGESGVGKEVIARFIHQHSSRRRGQFVAINCGALPESLLESELFGHKAGSFTGAIRDRVGLFEQAQGGTILLDEIGDVTLPMQVKLLRVLQEKQVRRVGENKTLSIDARVIAATNRKLGQDVKDGRFREDLFYRLRVVEIEIPPLRERPEDILQLARFFTERLAQQLQLSQLTLDVTCLKLLETYPWPGNVRELENALERAAIMTEDGRIRPEHLPPGMHDAIDSMPTTGPGRMRSLAEVERAHVLAVLAAVDGSQAQAARVLGMSPTTLWRRLKEWGEPR